MHSFYYWMEFLSYFLLCYKIYKNMFIPMIKQTKKKLSLLVSKKKFVHYYLFYLFIKWQRWMKKKYIYFWSLSYGKRKMVYRETNDLNHLENVCVPLWKRKIPIYATINLALQNGFISPNFYIIRNNIQDKNIEIV